LGLMGWVQRPVEGMQTPTEWHWSSARHATGFSPRHTPMRQTSLWVQRL
jgi:hypothetical protein